MKNFHSSLIIALVVVTLAGCAGIPNRGIPVELSEETFSVTDGLGRQVILKTAAERIVSLAPSNTELLFDVGAGAQVVGRDTFSDYPEQVTAIPDIGGSMGAYDYEAIAALKPDLVLAAEINTPEQVHSLENLGLVVYYLSNPKDLQGLYENLRTVGILTGHLADSEARVASLSARVTDLQTRLAVTTTQPSIYYELDATDPNLPYTLGHGTFGDYLINLARGTNIGARIGEGWVQIAGEDILASDPEYILLGDVYTGVTPESVLTRPGWADLSAVRNGHVVPFDDDLMSRPTSRLVDGFEALVRLIHPEVFTD